MKVIVGTKEEVVRKAAQRYVELLNRKPEAVLGLATGSTPLDLYAELARLCAEGKLSFAKAKSFNLDEYIGLEGTHDQSYRYFMDHNLFEHIDIRPENTHVPSGFVKDDAEAELYDAEIAAAGGVDLQLLGIGNNGHIGFNEPLTPFTSLTHIVKLTESTREANKRFFNSIDEVPTHAATMGVKPVMHVRAILLLAFGRAKAEALAAALNGPVTPEVPASVLQLHPDVTVLCDEEAAALL